MVLGMGSLWTSLQAGSHPGASRAQSTCSVTAKAAVQAGSVSGAPVQDLTLSFAFWAAEVKW